MLTPRTHLIDSFADTDTGLVRHENEDSVLLYFPPDHTTLGEKGVLAIVADGVGGSSGGKVASSTAISVIRDHYYSSEGDVLLSLNEAVKAANREIFAKAAKDPSCQGMASTCTALILRGDEGFLCHTGDSRAYLLRGGVLRQITEDHTLVGRLLSDGLITAEAAARHPQKNIIVRALGSEREIAPDMFHIFFERNDVVFLCSDGLHGLVTDDEIATLLSDLPTTEAGRSLVESAKEKGGTDNISVVILKISEGKVVDGDATKPFCVPPDGVSTSLLNRHTVLLGVVLAALLFGGFFFFLAMRG
jgi:protein phosphatase